MCDCDFGKGLGTCHCAGCHETFVGIRAFDLHQRLRDGGVKCLAPAELRRKDGTPVLRLDARTGFWRQNTPGLAPNPMWRKKAAVVPSASLGEAA